MQVTTSKARRQLGRQRFRRCLAIVDLRAALEGVQLGDAQAACRPDRCRSPSRPRRAIASASTPPPHPTSRTRRPASGARRSIHCEPHGVDIVQRAHRPLGIPPSRGKIAELAQFGLIDVHGGYVTGLPSGPCQRARRGRIATLVLSPGRAGAVRMVSFACARRWSGPAAALFLAWAARRRLAVPAGGKRVAINKKRSRS